MLLFPFWSNPWFKWWIIHNQRSDLLLKAHHLTSQRADVFSVQLLFNVRCCWIKLWQFLVWFISHYAVEADGCLFNPCHCSPPPPKCLWCVNRHSSTDCHCRPPWLLLWMPSGGVCLSINLTNVERGSRQTRIEFQYESHYKKGRPVCEVSNCHFMLLIDQESHSRYKYVPRISTSQILNCRMGRGPSELLHRIGGTGWRRVCLQPHWLYSLPLICDYSKVKYDTFFFFLNKYDDFLWKG